MANTTQQNLGTKVSYLKVLIFSILNFVHSVRLYQKSNSKRLNWSIRMAYTVINFRLCTVTKQSLSKLGVLEREKPTLKMLPDSWILMYFGKGITSFHARHLRCVQGAAYVFELWFRCYLWDLINTFVAFINEISQFWYFGTLLVKKFFIWIYTAFKKWNMVTKVRT